MANEQNLKPFKKGADSRRNMDGRPNGIKNRSTIARQVLSMNAILPNETMSILKTIYPDISERMTSEEIATIVMVGNAISKGDVNAYKAVMDSAYGAPKQDVDLDVKGSIQINIDNDDSKLGE